jgi:hypothetical protein
VTRGASSSPWRVPGEKPGYALVPTSPTIGTSNMFEAQVSGALAPIPTTPSITIVADCPFAGKTIKFW